MTFRIDHILVLAAGLAGIALAATTPSPFPLTVVANQPADTRDPEPVVVDVVPDAGASAILPGTCKAVAHDPLRTS